MFESLAQSTCPSIREWEEAGASLASALEKYLDLCCSLQARSSQEGTPPTDLATRIDHALETLQPTLDHKFALARSALSQSRNQIMSPIYSFPVEVLIEIFSHVIYTPPDPPRPVPMQERLVHMYRSLHSLLGVCNTWRNATMHHKSFWSTIPIIDLNPSSLAFNFTHATKLSLERSGNLDLHLAAIKSDERPGYAVAPLVDHARFRTVNISAKAPSDFRQLRDLRIISITTFPDNTDTPKISLPNLQYLLVRDLYNNTMHQILESISTRSHYLTLHLTPRCLWIQDAGQSTPEDDVDADELCELLTQVSVHTLLIDGEDEWVSSAELKMMMRVMPDLKNLQLHCWYINEHLCNALKRPISCQNQPETSLPALENIHISRSAIQSEETFKNMVASYSGCLRGMVLGAELPNDSETQMDPLEGDEDLLTWLKANVPELELIYEEYDPPEFMYPEWELW
ncbi:unnamed protein product [Rhizoctonia solani]|uniref:F-box domain-containing protein n=1 Tax=Rhizoctonia solani TaxID=456999 RepID=A0A8H3I215_9AGAM|nr:unnamed protein product [Rhizoctonia solani]